MPLATIVENIVLYSTESSEQPIHDTQRVQHQSVTKLSGRLPRFYRGFFKGFAAGLRLIL
jgi:hypothetical protein